VITDQLSYKLLYMLQHMNICTNIIIKSNLKIKMYTIYAVFFKEIQQNQTKRDTNKL
jgi:hypothetical protein